MESYLYGILKENTPALYLHQMSTVIPCEFKESKYALIEKKMCDDHTEKINRIVYGDDLDEMSAALKSYVSWYNYPAGLRKNMQQFVSEL